MFGILLTFCDTGSWTEALQAGFPQGKGYVIAPAESSELPADIWLMLQFSFILTWLPARDHVKKPQDNKIIRELTQCLLKLHASVINKYLCFITAKQLSHNLQEEITCFVFYVPSCREYSCSSYKCVLVLVFKDVTIIHFIWHFHCNTILSRLTESWILQLKLIWLSPAYVSQSEIIYSVQVADNNQISTSVCRDS